MTKNTVSKNTVSNGLKDSKIKLEKVFKKKQLRFHFFKTVLCTHILNTYFFIN